MLWKRHNKQIIRRFNKDLVKALKSKVIFNFSSLCMKTAAACICYLWRWLAQRDSSPSDPTGKELTLNLTHAIHTKRLPHGGLRAASSWFWLLSALPQFPHPFYFQVSSYKAKPKGSPKFNRVIPLFVLFMLLSQNITESFINSSCCLDTDKRWCSWGFSLGILHLHTGLPRFSSNSNNIVTRAFLKCFLAYVNCHWLKTLSKLDVISTKVRLQSF